MKPVLFFASMTLIGMAAASVTAAPQASEAACPPLLRYSMKGIDGKPRNLCQYRGQVLLVVNTASQCGYTPQYRQLQGLYQSYKARGFSVLAFPANNFAHQEPGSDAEIAKFCQDKYSVSFPLFSKTHVTGPQASPFFVQLTRKTGQAPVWNFHKYLIDRSGSRALSFGSGVSPDDARLRAELEKLLAQKKP